MINPISGATNPSLPLTGLTTNAAGSYSVMVTNVVGATNSVAATLSVNNQTATLPWPALLGRKFAVQVSSNLTSWTVAELNLVATSAPPTWTTATMNAAWYYRVVRVP